MGDDKELYEDEIERQWGEGATVQGIHPDLMRARQGRSTLQAPIEGAANFSPWMIPFSAVMLGPLVAAFLTILTDGDPPQPRQAMVVLCVGVVAWVINFGVAHEQFLVLAVSTASMVRMSVLVICGITLWAIYRYWMKGKKRLDRRALKNSAVIIAILSLLFWTGRGGEMWMWLGV